MVPFGGWNMPVSYGTGTIAEHMACRDSAVMFDVSHLGTIEVAGTGALESLQRTLTNDLGKISVGRTQYTHLLNDSGGVLDDIIVWWVAEQKFHVMPNASNTDRVVSALGTGSDITATRAIIAVQGPQARVKLATVSADAAATPRRGIRECMIRGARCTVAGTGYTGEDGVEIAVPADNAGEVWTALLEAGITPAGLGARDTLRLEAGLPLHGHELGPSINPLEAGLGWVVAWNKPEFCGRQALMDIRESGLTRKLVGLASEGRRPPRDGSLILVDGDEVGSVTSGNFSPVLGHGIAMGFVSADVSNEECAIDVRGTRLGARFTPLPFVPHRG